MGAIYNVSVPVVDYTYDINYYGYNPIVNEAYSPIAVGGEWTALQDGSDASYVPIWVESGGPSASQFRENILRARFKKFAIPEGAKILSIGLKMRSKGMTSLHTIAGYQRLDPLAPFVSPESIDTNLVIFFQSGKRYITEEEYLADPTGQDYSYVQYSYPVTGMGATLEDTILTYYVDETTRLGYKHPAYNSDVPVGQVVNIYPNDWNDWSEYSNEGTPENLLVSQAIREGTLGAIIAPDKSASNTNYGEIHGIEITDLHLEISFQVNYFAPMIPTPKTVSVATNVADTLYNFAVVGKVRSGVAMAVSWGSNDVGIDYVPMTMRAISVNRDTWQQTHGPVYIYNPVGATGHGYPKAPIPITNHVCLMLNTDNSSSGQASYVIFHVDDNLAITVLEDNYVAEYPLTPALVSDSDNNRALILSDGSSNPDRWITSDEHGASIVTVTTPYANRASNVHDRLTAGNVIFPVDATNSLVVGASGSVFAIDWTAHTITYVRTVLPLWSGDSTIGAICKGLAPNTVDILWRNGSSPYTAKISLLRGASVDGTVAGSNTNLTASGWTPNWNDWLQFDNESLMRTDAGAWLAVRSVTGPIYKSVLVYIAPDGQEVTWYRAIVPETATGDTTVMQFFSDWVDLGNGVGLGVQAETASNKIHFKTEGLTATRSDAILYIDAPEVPDPVYPDGPLWYVSEPGMVEKWIPAFIYDGIGNWQPCRMWDGTIFMESTIPLP